MNECIFCKIVQKEIPATLLFEDEDVVVFMDIGPIVKGHALVISKKHYESVLDVSDELLAKMHCVAKRVAQAQVDGLNADGVNILQNNGEAAGQEVSHIHIHIIPRFENDGHHWNWNPKAYSDFEEMNQLADKIRREYE